MASRAKALVGDYLRELEANPPRARKESPEAGWARKTEFVPRKDGGFVRRVVRPDGAVESERVVTSDSPAVARAETGLSQAEFARVIGVSARTLQEWEQGRRRPSRAARALLLLAAKRPDVFREVFHPDVH